MNLEIMIYLAGIAKGLKDLIELIGILSVIGSVGFIFIVSMFMSMDHGSDDYLTNITKNKKIVGKMPYIGIALVFVSILIPNDKTIYAIAAANVSKQIVQSKDFTTLYDKTYKLLEQKLDEQLEQKTTEKK